MIFCVRLKLLPSSRRKCFNCVGLFVCLSVNKILKKLGMNVHAFFMEQGVVDYILVVIFF